MALKTDSKVSASSRLEKATFDTALLASGKDASEGKRTRKRGKKRELLDHYQLHSAEV